MDFLKELLYAVVSSRNVWKCKFPFINTILEGSANTENSPDNVNDVVWEILSILPVKSLMRFRCVSRAWDSLISSSRFSATHLINYKKSLSDTHIMFMSATGRFKLSTLDNYLQVPIIEPFDLEFRAYGKKIVGSYNGIICLGGLEVKNVVILWNPSTKQQNVLPKVPLFDENLMSGELVFYQYGFGFDKSTNDFKVVGFSFPDGYNPCDASVGIFSLRRNQWKRIENYRGQWYHLDSSKFGNGRLHWIVDNNYKDWYICYLDLITEKYGIIQKPTDAEGVFHVNFEITYGCMYLICTDARFRHVWSLDGYGLGGDEIWRKLATVSSAKLRDPKDTDHCHALTNSAFLLTDSSEYVIFNIKDCSLYYPRILYSHDYISTETTYIPSLVSPFSTNQEIKR